MNEPEVLWRPPPDVLDTSRIGAYVSWLRHDRGLRFDDYLPLWEWSVRDLEGFWTSIAEHFGVEWQVPPETGRSRLDDVAGAVWFPGSRLNYAANVLRLPGVAPDDIVVRAHSETRPPQSLTATQLRDTVTRVAAGLRRLGVEPGDRVVAYLPNIPEAVVLLLAAATIGAVFSSCPPEFGVVAVLDRWSQIEPSVLVTVDRYVSGGVPIPRNAEVAQLRAQLPSLRHVVSVPFPEAAISGALDWADLAATPDPVPEHQTGFGDPLFVLFSSGTTGRPKPITHGHGGILLEHVKTHALHNDLGPGDRFLWTTGTGWMMWNYLVSGLAVGSGIVLYDGSPTTPDLGALWPVAADSGTTFLGASAANFLTWRKAGIVPREIADLSRLRGVGSTGSPLPAEGFRWVYSAIAPDDGAALRLDSVSGGTDVCTAFIAGNPLLPVHAGEISGPCLGAAVDSYGPAGRPVIGERGELVLSRPMPSMPVGFWGDTGGRRYYETYFTVFPGVWRHGDWVTVTKRRSFVVAGRSDATLNRAGVRMGTADFYSALEDEPQISDSLVVHLDSADALDGRLVLFVVPAPGVNLDSALRARLARRLRSALSPAHVPDEIFQVPEIPRTLTGKKLEIPIKLLLGGAAEHEVLAESALANPGALTAFRRIADRRRSAAPRS